MVMNSDQYNILMIPGEIVLHTFRVIWLFIFFFPFLFEGPLVKLDQLPNNAKGLLVETPIERLNTGKCLQRVGKIPI